MADQDPMQQANDMNDLIAQAAQVQADLQKAQEEILATNVEGQAGNGLVKVTMTGGAELVDLQIDKSVVDPEDVDTLQDLVEHCQGDHRPDCPILKDLASGCCH